MVEDDAGAPPCDLAGTDLCTGSGAGTGFSLGTSWFIAPGEEAYWCARETLASAVDVASYHFFSTTGLHDLAFSAGTSSEPDGKGACDGNEPDLEHVIASAATTVDDQVDFGVPAGANGHLDAGEQVLLRLHLINTTVQPIAGSSLMQAK